MPRHDHAHALYLDETSWSPEQPISVSLKLFNECSPESLTELVIHRSLVISCCSAMPLTAGFDRAFRKLGAAPVRVLMLRGLPLISCNVPHYVLVDS